MRRYELVARLGQMVADVARGQSAAAAASELRALASEVDGGSGTAALVDSAHAGSQL